MTDEPKENAILARSVERVMAELPPATGTETMVRALLSEVWRIWRLAGAHRKAAMTTTTENLGAEITWRIEQVWEAHKAQRRGFWKEATGKIPVDPPLTGHIRALILHAIHNHDSGLLKHEDREAWLQFSWSRAAGIGIYLDDWCCGRCEGNDVAAGGKRYLEDWRPWQIQRGKGDPVTKFGQLYFDMRDGID